MRRVRYKQGREDERQEILALIGYLARAYDAVAAMAPAVRAAGSLEELNAAFVRDPRATELWNLAKRIEQGDHGQYVKRLRELCRPEGIAQSIGPTEQL